MTQRLAASGPRSAGFTLIELLVVVAIISILAAMLLPALNRAKDAGRKAACINNLKQLGLVYHLYFSDWNEFFPNANGGDPIYPGLTIFGRYFANNTSILLCPSDKTAGRQISYFFNERLMFGANDCLGCTAPIKLSSLRKPSRVVLFREMFSKPFKHNMPGPDGWEHESNKWYYSSKFDFSAAVYPLCCPGNPDYLQDYSALWKAHARGSNVLLADGSVRYLDMTAYIGQSPGPATLTQYDVTTETDN